MSESLGGGAIRKSDALLSISECVESCAATDGFELLQSLAWHLIILALSVESNQAVTPEGARLHLILLA